MSDATYTIRVDASGVVAGSNKAKAALKGVGVEAVRVEKGMGRAEKSTGKLDAKLKRLAVTYLGARTFLTLAQDSVQAALRMEAVDQRLRIATGSAAGAVREMEFVRDVVDRLGLSLPESAEGFAKFSVALRGTSLEGDQARKIFESVAEASTVMRLTAEQTGGVFTALEQIVSKGTVSAEELRGQLGERLAGAFLTAADAMGVTTKKLGEMLQAGELTAEEFLPKFAEALHEDFGEASVEAADSAQAAFNRFNNAMFDLRAELGTKLIPKLVELSEKILEFSRSEEGQQAIDDLGDAMADAAVSAGQLFGAIQKLLGLGDGLANFLNKLTFGPDPDRLRQTAAVIERIERFLTFDQVGETAIAGRIRALADEIERTDEKLQNSQSIKAIEDRIAALDELALIQEKNANRLNGIAVAEERAAKLSEEALKKAAEEAKRYEDRVEDLKRTVDPLGTEIKEIEDRLEFLNEAFRNGDISIQQWVMGWDQAQGRLLEIDKEINNVTISIDKMKDAMDRPVHTGVGGIADEVSEMSKNTQKVATQDLPDLADSFSLVFDAAERVFDTIGEDEWAKAASAILRVVNAVVALQEALEAVEATKAAKNAANGVNGGGSGGYVDTASSAASAASALSSFASYVTVAIAVFQAWVAVIEAFTTHMENPDTVFVYNPSSGLNAQLPGYAQEKFDNLSPETLEQVGAATEALGEFARGFTESLRQIQEALGLAIPEDFGNFMVRVTESIEEGRDSIFRVTIDGVTRSFDSLADATGHAVQEFLQRAVASGAQVDEAIKQIISDEIVDPEMFQKNLLRVQELVDQANMSIGGLSALEIELSKLPASLQGLRHELEQLGLSADQVERLVGGQLVASLQAMRQQITGQGLSIEDQKAQQRSQAQLFNAERAMRIAELETRRAALEADLGLTRAEIELIRNGVKGYEQALRAKGKIYGAEIELIVKQIQAINKILDALAKIPEINLGNLKLPGIPKIPKIGNIGGGGSSGPSLADELRSLLDSLFPAEAEARRFQEQIAILDKAFEKGLITATRYQDALRLLREQMAEGIRDALDQLKEFRADLTGGAHQGVGNQLLVAQREALRAFNLAREGDPTKVADFISANRDLLDLLRGTFGSGAGFQSGLREILRRTGALEDLFGDQLENVLGDPAKDTAEHTAQMVVHQMRIEKNTQSSAESSRLTAERTQRIENEARMASTQNQLGHGKTRTEIEDVGTKIDKKLDELARRFERAVERNRAA